MSMGDDLSTVVGWQMANGKKKVLDESVEGITKYPPFQDHSLSSSDKFKFRTKRSFTLMLVFAFEWGNRSKGYYFATLTAKVVNCSQH